MTIWKPAYGGACGREIPAVRRAVCRYDLHSMQKLLMLVLVHHIYVWCAHAHMRTRARAPRANS